MRKLDLDSLDIFRTVAREGGILRAAERLHRVPSNVTTRIKQLEQRLEVPLFRRQGRGIALTEAGEALLAHADRLLTIASQAEAEMSSGRALSPFRLGAMESTAGARLPGVLARMHAEMPDVAIELHTGTTAALVRKVSDYELDAAFVGEPFREEGLSSRAVFKERLVLVSALGCAPVVGPGDMGPADLDGGAILAFPKGCSYRRRLEEWLAAGDGPPRRVMELASYHAIIAAAAAGAGYGIVPQSLLATLAEGRNIAVHDLPDGIAVNRTHLVWKGEATAHVTKLLAMLG